MKSSLSIPTTPQPMNQTIKPILYVKEKAELKIRLTMTYGDTFETSWFGVVQKYGKNYLLKNILIPPQENERSFVTTKDDEYPQWFFEQVIKKNLSSQIRLHGHTHPTFAVFPSGTDVQQFNELLTQVDDFFIQMILNNKMEYICLLHIKGQKEPIKMEIIFEYGKKMEKILKQSINKKYIPSGQMSIWDFAKEVDDPLDIDDADALRNYYNIKE
jgi:hypothetical protein